MAEEKLGNRFDIREFHHVILKEVDSEDRVNAIIERYSNNDRVKIRNVEQYENDLGDILIHFRKLKNCLFYALQKRKFK